MSADGLLERVVVASELSPVFARKAIERALRRASVDPARLNEADLQRALPELRRTLKTYLETRAEVVMRQIELLARM